MSLRSPPSTDPQILLLAQFANMLSVFEQNIIETIKATNHDPSARLASHSQAMGEQIIFDITSQTKAVIHRELTQILVESGKQIQQSTSELDRSVRQFDDQREKLWSGQRRLVIGGFIALIIGSIMTVGISSYQVWKNSQELKRFEFGQKVMTAMQDGTIAYFGANQQLCIKVGKKPQFGDQNKEYALVHSADNSATALNKK